MKFNIILISFLIIFFGLSCNNFETFIPNNDGPEITMEVGIDSDLPLPLAIADSSILNANLGDSTHYFGLIKSDERLLDSVQIIVSFENFDSPISDVTKYPPFTTLTEEQIDFGFRLSNSFTGTYEVNIIGTNETRGQTIFTIFIIAQ